MSFRLAMVLFLSKLRYCFTGGVQILPEVSPPEVSPPEVSPPEVSPPGVTTPGPLSVSPLFPHADNKNTDPHTVKTIAIIIANSFFIVSPFNFWFFGDIPFRRFAGGRGRPPLPVLSNVGTGIADLPTVAHRRTRIADLLEPSPLGKGGLPKR